MRILFLIPVLVCLFFTAACFGGSEGSLLDTEKAASGSSSENASSQQAQIEIPIGLPEGRVIQLLGPPATTENLGDGRHFWRYPNKRANFVYVSNSDKGHTLVIGNYVREPDAKSTGLPLMLTLVIDSNRKVVDFNFTQLAF